MPRIIEVTVSPQGNTSVETKGYSGSDCLQASRLIEQALGITINDQKSAEFYQSSSIQQHEQNQA